MYQRYETRTGLVLLFLLRELNISCEGDLTRHSLEISPCQAARLGHGGLNFDFFLLAGEVVRGGVVLNRGGSGMCSLPST